MSYTRLLHKTLNCLTKAFKPKRYLEIGVREGDSLKAVLDAYMPKWVFLCDTWGSSYGGTGRGDNIHIVNIITKYPNSQMTIWNFLDGRSEEYLPILIKHGRKFDLITVDGDHSYNGAMSDLQMAWQLLAKNGILVFDDVIHPNHKYLRECIESFIKQVKCRVLKRNYKEDNGIVVLGKNE